MRVHTSARVTTCFGALIVSVLVFLIGAPAAGAAGYVPNPDMETSCGALPCNWVTSTGGQTETSIFHAGATSLSIFVPNPSTGSLGSTCANGAAAGSYESSLWYRASAPGFIQFSLFYYDAPGCAGTLLGPGSIGIQTGVGTDSAWHHYGITGVAPAGTRSILVQINYGCSGCSTARLYIDDVLLEGRPSGATSVTLSSLRAVRGRAGVDVAWRTRLETRLLGFELWRDGRKLTTALIPARGGTSGAKYRLLDRRAPAQRPVVYRLVAVDVSGGRRLLGVARANPR